MHRSDTVKWGIFSTANIARGAFLPALKSAGGGTASLVAGRDRTRAEHFARENGVERAVEGYRAVVEDENVQAIYNPLPNSMHAEWTIRALEAGKHVLCEKPLCGNLPDTERVLEAARHSTAYLWEAFVFPFQPQYQQLTQLLADGAIGELQEIHSSFHFRMRDRNNIRLNPSLEGGALNDVGCYPLHLARLLFDAAPDRAVAMTQWAPEGVDDETQGILNYSEDRRLVFSCGMRRSNDTYGRLIGSEGIISLTNPFHAGPNDSYHVHTPDRNETLTGGEQDPSFTWAIKHIHAVIRGDEQPRHLATEDALATAQALQAVREVL